MTGKRSPSEKGETVTCKMEIPQKVSAPVLKGEKLGRIAYYLDGKLIDFIRSMRRNQWKNQF